MSLPVPHVLTVCNIGKGEETCSFLMMAPRFACAKGTEIEPEIRARREEGTMTAMGDNCEGWTQE